MATVQEQTLIAWQQTQSVQHPQAKDQQVPSESKGYTRPTVWEVIPKTVCKMCTTVHVQVSFEIR